MYTKPHQTSLIHQTILCYLGVFLIRIAMIWYNVSDVPNISNLICFAIISNLCQNGTNDHIISYQTCVISYQTYTKRLLRSLVQTLGLIFDNFFKKVFVWVVARSSPFSLLRGPKTAPDVYSLIPF